MAIPRKISVAVTVGLDVSFALVGDELKVVGELQVSSFAALRDHLTELRPRSISFSIPWR
jgi:hypothetical protein